MAQSYEKTLFTALKNAQKELLSSYDIWKSLGNEGGPEEFLESLKGESAYEVWLSMEGNAGKSQQEFFQSIAAEVENIPMNGILLTDTRTGDINIIQVSNGILKAAVYM